MSRRDKAIKTLQSKAEKVIKNDYGGNWGGLNQVLGFGFPPFGLGTELNQLSTLFQNNRWYLLSNMRQPLSEIYVEHGIIQTLINVPVDDAFRGGIEIKTKQLDPQEIEDIHVEMEEHDDLGAVAESHYWNGLYGGAGIITMTDQDPAKPFEIERIRKNSPLEFRSADMWELFWDQQNLEGFSGRLQPLQSDFEYYQYYGLKVHKTRVQKLVGLKAPSFIRPRLRGWGFSKLESIVNSINQYLKANNLSFEVLDEFKVDYYKIKNFNAALLNPAGAEALAQRLAIANQQKNYNNAMVMDSEDDMIQKVLTFAGLAEVWREIKIQLACDLRMPLSKIFGIGAQGFSSGEDDIENYNAMVERTVRAKGKREVLNIVKMRCQKIHGFVPDDIRIGFQPLRILGAEQEENVKNSKFQRVLAAKQAGEITQDEFRDACNKGQLLDIQLEKGVVLPDQDSDSDPNEEPGDNKAPSTKIKVKKAESKEKAPEAKS